MWLRLRERFTFVVLLKVVAIECTDTGWQAAELAAERQRRDADFAEERALLKAQNSRLREGLKLLLDEIPAGAASEFTKLPKP